ncbi:hypothetical protein BDC45DRAFT_506983 [Circinella umbellata]|nr:hypothetical protein BDC45DRAFT_506983 [Circinella umbellata]
MTLLNKKIEQYLNGEKKPLYSAFLSDSQNISTITTYFTQYANKDQAVEAFDRKFKAILRRMPPLTQRSTRALNTEVINWDQIFQDSRTQLEYRIQSSRILAAAAAPTADTIITGLNANNDSSSESGSSSRSVSKDHTYGLRSRLQNASDNNDNNNNANNNNQGFPDIKPAATTCHINEMELTVPWNQYQKYSLNKAYDLNLHLVSDLQKVLSLSSIMLLNKNSNDEEFTRLFGKNINSLHSGFRNMFIDGSIVLGENIFASLERIVQKIIDAEPMSLDDPRDEAYMEISLLMKNADKGDRAVLRAMNNLISKLPSYKTSQTIGETELVTNYLDPLLSPMFHDPHNRRLFRWLNRKEDVATNQKPYGGMTVVEQMHQVNAAGFVEVKPPESANHHYDTHKDNYQLATFCKEAIDSGDTKCAMGIQAVGFNVDFYLCSFYHETIYPFVNLGRISLPNSIETLLPFLMHLRLCKQITMAYDKYCVRCQLQESIPEKNKRATLNPDQLSNILHEIHNTKLPTLNFQ